MARPLSEEKQAAILEAAIKAIAAEGVGAATARIAKAAGVASGSLFVYFPTKDALFEALYRHLKAEVAEEILCGYPGTTGARERVRHVFDRYVGWGVREPERRRAMAHLAAAPSLSARALAEAEAPLAPIGLLLRDVVRPGLDVSFAALLMTAMTNATIEAIVREPRRAEAMADSGFDAVWRAIALM